MTIILERSRNTDIYVGAQRRIAVVFAVNGVNADPTTVTFRYKAPTALLVEELVYGPDVEVVKTAVGNYYVDLTLSETGTWVCTFTGAGAVIAVGRWTAVVTDPFG